MIQHLWIIMDGNRRWAKSRWKLSVFWHKAWFENAVKVSQLVAQKWIQYLTLWALSKENLESRDDEELKGIIWLIELIPTLIPIFKENKSRFQTIGDISKLPSRSQKILSQVTQDTLNFWEKVTILALVYGWQDEIIRGIKNFVYSQKNVEELNQINFRDFLDSGKYPPPDLIIRTGWDVRHSGFLLYESAYSEYFFSEKLWPDFDSAELDRAIEQYQSSKRNFWK